MSSNSPTELEILSQSETPLSQNIDTQGPGGQAYDLAPTARRVQRVQPIRVKYSRWTRGAGCFALGLCVGYGWKAWRP